MEFIPSVRVAECAVRPQVDFGPTNRASFHGIQNAAFDGALGHQGGKEGSRDSEQQGDFDKLEANCEKSAATLSAHCAWRAGGRFRSRHTAYSLRQLLQLP